MRLILKNGYPFPYNLDLSQAEQDKIADEAASHTLEIEGVTHFEWLHTLTIEFDGLLSANRARDRTGWETWGSNPRVLEAKWSPEDGYHHPAIVVGERAYCGFVLLADKAQ
jgi:hypothetical protein